MLGPVIGFLIMLINPGLAVLFAGLLIAALYVFRPPNPDIKNGVITWHKHWLVLLGAVLAPLALLIVLVILAWLTGVNILMLALMLLGIGVMSYVFTNWWNDIYVLTADRIIDIEKIPIIKEDSRQAFLEQIQDVRFVKPNFVWNYLNVGNVIIQTAGRAESAFTFEAVPNPLWVQEQVMARKRDSRRRELSQQGTEIANAIREAPFIANQVKAIVQASYDISADIREATHQQAQALQAQAQATQDMAGELKNLRQEMGEASEQQLQTLKEELEATRTDIVKAIQDQDKGQKSATG
jgi:hypothetical protein